MFKVNTSKIKKTYLIEKLNIIETPDYKYLLTDNQSLFEEGKINILFSEENIEDIRVLVKTLSQGASYYINVENTQGVKHVDIKDILYFEALDNDVFAIVGNVRYYVLEKLYVLEQALTERNFVRVSKSFLVNIAHINFIKPMINSKLKLIMDNKDVVEVNRTYVKTFKERMEL